MSIPKLANDDRPIWERIAELSQQIPQACLDELAKHKTYRIKPLRVVHEGERVHLYRHNGFRVMTVEERDGSWRVIWGSVITAKVRFKTKDEAIEAAQKDWVEFTRQDLDEVQP
jgi:hypothetical protein